GDLDLEGCWKGGWAEGITGRASSRRVDITSRALPWRDRTSALSKDDSFHHPRRACPNGGPDRPALHSVPKDRRRPLPRTAGKATGSGFHPIPVCCPAPPAA